MDDRKLVLSLLILGWLLAGVGFWPSKPAPASEVRPDSASLRWYQERAVIAETKWLEEKQRNWRCYFPHQGGWSDVGR